MRMTSEPRRRISSCRSPTALTSLSSERNELEQTNSASAAVLCAAVVRSGRISWSTTGTPFAAICQAASAPASPPPTTCTICDASQAMDRNYSCREEATMQAPPAGDAWQVDLALRARLPPRGFAGPSQGWMSFGLQAAEGAHRNSADERQQDGDERNKCCPKNCKEDHLVAGYLR